MLEARGLFRSAICFRSILSRQNGLNRHLEQKQKIAGNSVFQFFGPRGLVNGPRGLVNGIHGTPTAQVILPKVGFLEAPPSFRQVFIWLRGSQTKSEDQPGGPRTNLEVFGDEVSFQYFPKT